MTEFKKIVRLSKNKKAKAPNSLKTADVSFSETDKVIFYGSYEKR